MTYAIGGEHQNVAVTQRQCRRTQWRQSLPHDATAHQDVFSFHLTLAVSTK
jgi:hypothetical protein